MGRIITPQVHIDTNSRNEHLMHSKHYPHNVLSGGAKFYKTYRKLKADLKRLMNEYYVTEVTVYRSRRGEWGEWYEHWHLSGGKLIKGKCGWS